jgi:hypothetical protein
MTGDRVRLPADVELEDRLAFGLTARQLAILIATAVVAYGAYAAASTLLPVPVAAAAATPVALLGVGLALGRLDGLSGDRLALAAVLHVAQPRRRALAPDGPRPRGIGGLRAPVRAVLRNGLVEVDGSAWCLLLRATGASFELRSTEEQAALTDAYGRFLNSLTDPVQIAVRSEPLDLAGRAAALKHAAGRLPHPALRDAASGHAQFLAGLSAEGGLRRREILLILTARARDRATALATLRRRQDEARELLRAAGVELHALPGAEAANVLARAIDPPGPPAGCELTGEIHAC